MKLFNQTISISFAALAVFATPAIAQNTLFFDDFNGPTVNSAWSASMPNFNEADTGATASYLGAPNFAFQSLGGYSVLNMDDTLNNQQRRGWMTSTVFTAPGFIYQARFNTLTQSNTTSIDSFLELSVFSAANHNLYDIVSPYEGGYSGDPRFAVGSSIDNSYGGQSFTFQNNTWYNLLIEALPGQDIQMVLENDSGTPLIEQTLGHTSSVFSSGFQIGLSQGMGFPNSSYPTDVDVDYVKLTAVPEPASLPLTLAGVALVFGIAKKRGIFVVRA